MNEQRKRVGKLKQLSDWISKHSCGLLSVGVVIAFAVLLDRNGSGTLNLLKVAEVNAEAGENIVPVDCKPLLARVSTLQGALNSATSKLSILQSNVVDFETQNATPARTGYWGAPTDNRSQWGLGALEDERQWMAISTQRSVVAQLFVNSENALDALHQKCDLP